MNIPAGAFPVTMPAVKNLKISIFKGFPTPEKITLCNYLYSKELAIFFGRFSETLAGFPKILRNYNALNLFKSSARVSHA